MIQIQVSEIVGAIDFDQPGKARLVRARLEDIITEGETVDFGFFWAAPQKRKANRKIRKSNLSR